MLRHQTSSKVGAVTAVAANKVLNVIDRDGALAKASRSKVGQAVKIPVNFLLAASYTPTFAAITAVDGMVRRVKGQGILDIHPDMKSGPVAEVPVRMELEDFTVNGISSVAEVEVPIKVYRSRDTLNTTCFGLPLSVHRPNEMTEGWEKTTETWGEGEFMVIFTRLKRKTLIPQEYYFKGELSDADAVRIATQNQPAHKTANYAGEVSSREGLSPVVGFTKQALIRHSLGCFEAAISEASRRRTIRNYQAVGHLRAQELQEMMLDPLGENGTQQADWFERRGFVPDYESDPAWLEEKFSERAFLTSTPWPGYKMVMADAGNNWTAPLAIVPPGGEASGQVVPEPPVSGPIMSDARKQQLRAILAKIATDLDDVF